MSNLEDVSFLEFKMANVKDTNIKTNLKLQLATEQIFF